MNEPPIDLRVWRQFLAVADELHFGRAASRLHMTQPPLTQAIAQLERSLDVALFERSSRHVALTPAGEALVPQVRELLAQAAALPGIARAAAADRKSTRLNSSHSQISYAVFCLKKKIGIVAAIIILGLYLVKRQPETEV